jgi:predicted ATPase
LPEVTGDEVVPPRLGYEGEDLSACLYFMHETKDPALDVILEKVRALLPGFLRLEFNILGADRVAFSVEFDDERETVAAVRISHGVLLFLGLMVLTYSPNRPPVMLIEEPENGLTPTALKEFYKAIRELAHKEVPTQRSQVLISSHSPFIICEAWNGDDREFIHQVKVEGGRATVRKFSEAIKEQGIHLQKDKKGERTILGLRTAEELMSGYLS